MRYKTRRSLLPFGRVVWYVFDDQATSPGDWEVCHLKSEALAEVFAFALNTIAEGDILWRRPPLSKGGLHRTVTYTGPTEGIAP